MCQDADTGSRLHSCGGRRDSGYIYDACALYVPYAFKMHGRHKTACVYGFYDVHKGMVENNLYAVYNIYNVSCRSVRYSAFSHCSAGSDSTLTCIYIQNYIYKIRNERG